MTECAQLYSPSQCTDTRYMDDILVDYQKEPSCGRGTTGIVWNCLIVMTFCAWSVIHLDTKTWSVPSQFRHKTEGSFWKPWSKVLNRDSGSGLRVPTPLELLARKVFEALALLLFPEYGLLVAIEELSIARLIHHTTRKIDGWEMFSLKQAHLVRMGGVYLPQVRRPEDFPLFVVQNALLLEYSNFPSEEKINLRAKRDIMDKVVALFQALYFICNIAFRNSRGYRIATLELLTINYIAYSTMNFLVRLKKPQELYEAFEIDWVELPSPICPEDSNSRIVRHPRLEKWTWLAMAMAIIAINLVPFAILRRQRSFSLSEENSDPEKFLVIIAFVGFAATLIFMLWGWLKRRQWERDTGFKNAIYYCGLTFVYCAGLGYVAFRSYLLWSVFGNLHYLPTGVYLTAPSWTQYLAHAGS
jgi:hypothetical protein